MKRSSTLFLKIAVCLIGVVMLGLLLLWLPWMATEAATQNPEYAHLKLPVLIGLYGTALPFYFALFQAFILLRHIEREQAFSNLAVNSLGKIKNSAIAIIVMYIFGMSLLFVQKALHPGIAIIGLVIIIATVVISLFAAVLQELLRSVLEIKSENDLTV